MQEAFNAAASERQVIFALPAVPLPAVFSLHGKRELSFPQLTAFQPNAFALL